jgi:hypothetical protein
MGSAEMSEDQLSPEEIGKRMAERSMRELTASLPAIQMSAAVLACLQQLVRLLIDKGVIAPQETLDAFARASDEIQPVPDSEIAVRIVEQLCTFVAKLPGAKRPSA